MTHLAAGRPVKQNVTKLGFYGCTNQLVRVSCVVEKGKRAPIDALIDCPACGNKHHAKNFMWRKPHSADEFALAQVHLEESDA
jgi:hypothetical protein